MEFNSCPRRHAEEIAAAIGSALCAPCIRQVRNNLIELPPLHQECLDNVSPEFRTISRSRTPRGLGRDAVDASALDSRCDILAVLGSWSELVIEGLRLAAPIRTVPCLAQFLASNLSWLTAQPPAAEFADEIEELKAAAQRIVDPRHDVRPKPIGECVIEGCTGIISIHPQGVKSAGNRGVSCSIGHSWEIGEWIMLSNLMEWQGKGRA